MLEFWLRLELGLEIWLVRVRVKDRIRVIVNMGQFAECLCCLQYNILSKVFNEWLVGFCLLAIVHISTNQNSAYMVKIQAK